MVESRTEPLARRTPLAATTTSAARDFEIRGLPACRCQLDAIAAGCAPLRRTIDLPATGIVLEFAPEARLDVQLLDRLDRPVAGVALQLQSADGARAWEGTSGDDGRCLFAGLPSGDWLVGAFPHDLGSSRKAGGAIVGGTLGHAMRVVPSLFRPEEAVTLSAGETRSFVLRLPEPAPCRITIVDEGGALLHDVPLAIDSAGLAGWHKRAWGSDQVRGARSSNGRFEIELVPDRYVAFAGESPRTAHASFDVLPVSGGEVTLVVPMGAALARIEGRLVELGSGRPVAGGSVSLQREGGSPFDFDHEQYALVDAEGSFSFDELLAGRVTLKAHGPSRDPLLAKLRHSFDWFMTTLTIDATADAPNVVELPIARRELGESDGIAVRLRLRDRATGAWLQEGRVALHGYRGAAAIAFETHACGTDGRVALRIPRVDRCTAFAAAPDFVADPVTHRLDTIELPIVAGAIDAVLELDAVKQR